MQKRNMIGMVGAAAGVATISYMLMDKNKRSMLMDKWSDMKDYLNTENTDLPIEEAGDPGKDQLENADMVAEGSQFGVDYYNKVKQ
ncbi:hypothetical protein MUN88_18370 [Gracilibacillus caseinilyticus]|uniref:YtxH-like protein n=1 Tax=Gracilibacillus caseinilyticus TaxID=2932256 RepID=A0ABY4EUA6_9BACI|nr:hypothetical protein [Gracilibacillus caseinilyticus]UOQ47995.1 hypothetical protein MUN88_18370 [Gracilibacillus caseinilyticus]